MATSASHAMIATNATFMGLTIAAVALRLQVRWSQKSFGFTADDWLIVASLVWFEFLVLRNPLFDRKSKFFSIALAITNIIGVPIGGFGVPFASLGEAKAQTFLKVFQI